MINSLKSKEYIDTELIYKENTKQVEMRKLIPIKNKDTYLRKVKYPPQENFNIPIKEKFKDNKINNKYNSENKNYKNNKDNFEQRKYDDIDLTRLYANVDAFI